MEPALIFFPWRTKVLQLPAVVKTGSTRCTDSIAVAICRKQVAKLASYATALCEAKALELSQEGSDPLKLEMMLLIIANKKARFLKQKVCHYELLMTAGMKKGPFWHERKAVIAHIAPSQTAQRLIVLVLSMPFLSLSSFQDSIN